MNVQQRQAIHRLRGEGLSYAKISALTGISENTVKSYCRRNIGDGDVTAVSVSPFVNFCRQCGSPLKQSPGAKPKRFCSDKCRLTWWNAHPEAINHRVVHQIICQSCGREFTSYGNITRKYCSRTCYGKSKVAKT